MAFSAERHHFDELWGDLKKKEKKALSNLKEQASMVG